MEKENLMKLVETIDDIGFRLKKLDVSKGYIVSLEMEMPIGMNDRGEWINLQTGELVLLK
jgi:hypothetical protein